MRAGVGPEADAGAGEGAGANASAACAHACPALGACMPAALWCDGEQDCPGGIDEVRAAMVPIC